jgi:hypothetical protein
MDRTINVGAIENTRVSHMPKMQLNYFFFSGIGITSIDALASTTNVTM